MLIAQIQIDLVRKARLFGDDQNLLFLMAAHKRQQHLVVVRVQEGQVAVAERLMPLAGGQETLVEPQQRVRVGSSASTLSDS